MLTQSLVRELFSYDGQTGDLRWLVSKARRIKVGDVAGTIHLSKDKKRSYRRVCVDGKIYGAHQIVFLHVNGYVPEEIDHQDRDGLNNREANLRDCTRSQNSANKVAYSTNTSGIKGVSFCKSTGKWRASITRDRVCKNLGRYATKEEAAAAYEVAAKLSFEEFARAS